MSQMVIHTLEAYYELLKSHGYLEAGDLKGKNQTEVTYLTYDSQAVVPGTLFICKGAAFKEAYLEDAIGRGAVAYVSETEYEAANRLPWFKVSDVRKAMAELANLYFNQAWEDLTLIGLTGTKGKSTAGYYIKAIVDDYMAAVGGKESGIISSIDLYDGVLRHESHITTPESVVLQEHFRHGVDSGMSYMEMEVSSQALKYDRVMGTRFDVGVFLNISEDHISPIEHVDFEDYFSSKLKFFPMVETACVNLDSDYIDRILEAAKASKKVVTFGTQTDHGQPDVYGYNVRKADHQILFMVRTRDFDEEFILTMPGLFNVENALAAIAVCLVCHIPLEYIHSGLFRARSSGRMELYASKDNQAVAIVDYAHNKLSFEKLFASTMEEYPGYDIVPIFGCPGYKAYLRRKHLGTIAGQFSKKVYLVAEDPGKEPVMQICEDIAQYIRLSNCPYEMIEDRGEAIDKAINEITRPTVFLITGKGNETRQKYGTEYVDCKTDVQYVLESLKKYDETH